MKTSAPPSHRALAVAGSNEPARHPLEGWVELIELQDGIPFVCDPRTLAVWVFGARAQPLLGRTPGERHSAEQFWGQLVPEPERSRVMGVLQAVARDGVSRVMEHEVVGEDEPLWFRTSVRREGEGSLLGMMLNVTSARHAERQWQEVSGWLSSVAETLPFDFWICDRQGTYVLQNPAFQRHFGNSVGSTPEEVALPAPSFQHWRQAFPRALAGESMRAELSYQTGEGMRHYARVVAPVRIGEAIHGVLGVDLDVTELKRTEERLRRSLEELEQAQETIVRRRQLAALGEMSAIVAHEVRNPLGAMSNALVLIRKRGAVQAEDLPLFQVIEDELVRLERLVVNLLDFVRPMTPSLEAESMAEVVERALTHTLSTDGRDKAIQVWRTVEPGLPLVEMDRNLLGLAFMNLIRNAVQAMPKGGELRVQVSSTLRDGEKWVVLSVKDNGPGLSPEVKKRLFEPFVTTRMTGSGLGLTIVRRIVEEHRGELTLTSQPGEGTLCLVSLPAAGKGG